MPTEVVTEAKLRAVHGSLPTGQTPAPPHAPAPATALPPAPASIQPSLTSTEPLPPPPPPPPAADTTCMPLRETVNLPTPPVNDSPSEVLTHGSAPCEGVKVNRQWPDPFSVAGHSSPGWINKSNASGLLWPQQWIRAWFLLRSNFLFSNYVLRIGPVTKVQFDHMQNSHSPVNRRSVGFGFDLSLGLLCCKRLNVEIFVASTSALRQSRLAIFWNMECPRVVSQRADILQCIRDRSIDGVRQLLGSGQASAKDTTIYGITLLHTASSTGHSEMVRVLIEAGADVNTPDEDGETPLHRALSTKNNYDTAKLLIESGADLANVAVGNRTPLHTIFNDTVGEVLSRRDCEDVGPDSEGMSVTHFLAWSSKTTPETFERGRTHDIINLWLADSFGKTCLHYAASRGNVGVLTYLLERASSLEIGKADHHGLTAVHYTVRSSRMAVVLQLLLKKGINMYATDLCLQNVLHHAAKWSKLEDIQKLIALDPNDSLLSPDNYGHMPSQVAYKMNSSNVYEYLERLESAKRFTSDAINKVKSD